MRLATIALLGCVSLGAFVPLACGADERLNTEPVGSADAGKDVTTDTTTPDSGKDSGPPIRSVETRPRFGALDPGNFLLDGDFEYSGMDAMQYPWFGVEHTFVVTGARCRQGLRCIEVPNGGYVFGTFVWPDAGFIDVEYYAKPLGTGDCTEEVGGVLIALADYPGAPQSNMVASATDPTPGADGWCHVSVNFPVPTDTGNVFWALLLAPRQDASGGILVDEASIRVPGSASANAVSAPRTDLAKLVARARNDFARRPPAPPRGPATPVRNPTARRAGGRTH